MFIQNILQENILPPPMREIFFIIGVTNFFLKGT